MKRERGTAGKAAMPDAAESPPGDRAHDAPSVDAAGSVNGHGEDGNSGGDRSPASVSATREDAVAAEVEQVRVVQPGDSLWAIAERRLGPHASDAEIAREVNRLWELNDTEVIKTGDPDLILPGQRLRL
jgi:nucleoid-associated protein YgaU